LTVYNKYFRTRERTKHVVMLLFYANYETEKPPYYQVFKTLFPEEVQLMDIIKKAGKSIFAKILQAVEAHLMLVLSGKELTKLYPHMAFLTVHDSILVEDINLQKVEKVIEKVLFQHVGHMPGLKIENLDADTTINKINSTAKSEWTEIMLKVNVAKDKNWLQTEDVKFSIEPLLYEKPYHKGKTLFSSRFFKRK
jgi:hypothetical protein